MLLSGRSLATSCKWNTCPRYGANVVRQFSYILARHGDSVFINLDYVRNFLAHFAMWGSRGKKFVLVCQNSDREFNSAVLERLRPYALHIYSINCVIQDPMVTAIPIGFGDWSIDYLPGIDKTPLERTIQLLAGFSIGTNPALRQPCQDAMQKDPRALVGLTKFRKEFYDRLRITKYVVCPEGEGHDTHRIYEGIYFGAVPILIRPNPLAFMYEGWPIKWVDSWEDIDISTWEEDYAKLNAWVEANPDWATTKFQTIRTL